MSQNHHVGRRAGLWSGTDTGWGWGAPGIGLKVPLGQELGQNLEPLGLRDPRGGLRTPDGNWSPNQHRGDQKPTEGYSLIEPESGVSWETMSRLGGASPGTPLGSVISKDDEAKDPLPDPQRM